MDFLALNISQVVSTALTAGRIYGATSLFPSEVREAPTLAFFFLYDLLFSVKGLCGGMIDVISNVAISAVHGADVAPWMQVCQLALMCSVKPAEGANTIQPVVQMLEKKGCETLHKVSWYEEFGFIIELTNFRRI